MKTRNDFVSNSSSSSFIVDEDTNMKYIEKYGFPALEGFSKEYNGINCVEYWGADDEHTDDDYDNDEELLESIYDGMCLLNPKFIDWKNHH